MYFMSLVLRLAFAPVPRTPSIRIWLPKLLPTRRDALPIGHSDVVFENAPAQIAALHSRYPGADISLDPVLGWRAQNVGSLRRMLFRFCVLIIST